MECQESNNIFAKPIFSYQTPKFNTHLAGISKDSLEGTQKSQVQECALGLFVYLFCFEFNFLLLTKKNEAVCIV